MQKILHRDLVNIAVSNTLRQFGGGLVEVFVPLLLTRQGFSLFDVALFYVAYAFIKLTINYHAMRLTNEFGARPSLIVARLGYIGYLLCLTFIVSNDATVLIWPMAAALAITNAFQWNAEHAHISRVMDTTRKGRDIAAIESFNLIASSVAPALAALLALLLNTTIPLIVAILCIAISVIWLWSIDNQAGGHERQDGLQYSLGHAPVGDLVANFAFNVHAAIGVLVWPMYLAYALSTFGAIGWVSAVGSLGALLLLAFVGRRNDRLGTARVLREGSYLTFVSHLSRLLPANIGTITGINVFWLMAIRYQHNAWVSMYYAHARARGLKYILSMEIACDMGYIATFVGLAACLWLFDYQLAFMVIFGVAALISLACTRITDTRP